MINTALKGFCMGTADIIPGVSGGTIALILGFYTRLIKAIRAFDSTLLTYLYRGDFRTAIQHIDLLFLLSLGTGIIAALLFFTRIIPLPLFIRDYPELVYGLFFGLLVASVGVLFRRIELTKFRDGGWLLLGTLMGYQVITLVPMNTPEAPWFIFVSGALATCAMILPGISGAFVLLILKKYTYLLDAIGTLDFGVLIPFGLGAATGVMLFSRFLEWLIRNYYQQTFRVITGILIGSLWIIWPFQARTYQTIEDKSYLIDSVPIWPQELTGTVVVTFGLIIVGIVTVIVLDSLAKGSTQLR